MVRPTARVLALLEILQNGGVRTAPDLAQRLGVDERTVRRYVAHLLDLGIPVASVRGRFGGYRLSPGFRLPPLMLTDDEAVAVLLGLVTGSRAAGGTSRLATESAIAKVRRALPKRLAARLDALLDVSDFTAGAHPGAPPTVDVLLLVAEAARDRCPVELVYSDRDGRSSERTVQPYGVVVHGGHWYVTGIDSISSEVRTFRLDRVAAARRGTGVFEVPTTFEPQDEVLAALARTPWRHEVSVKVRGGADVVRPRLPKGLANVTDLVDEPGWVRVRMRAERLDWVPGVLAALDAELVVEAPDELRDLVRALARRLWAAVGTAV